MIDQDSTVSKIKPGQLYHWDDSQGVESALLITIRHLERRGDIGDDVWLCWALRKGCSDAGFEIDTWFFPDEGFELLSEMDT